MLNHGHLYKAALTELEEQFGNEERVAGAFMKTAFDHPIVAEGDVTQQHAIQCSRPDEEFGGTLMIWHLQLTHVLVTETT